MTPTEAVSAITPSDLQCCVQDWRRDPSTWRQHFFNRHLPANPEVAESNRIKLEELAAGLEGYLNGLPEIKLYPGRAAPAR